jgi:hypothetical protein
VGLGLTDSSVGKLTETEVSEDVDWEVLFDPPAHRSGAGVLRHREHFPLRDRSQRLRIESMSPAQSGCFPRLLIRRLGL